MLAPAIVLANGCYQSPNGKVAHGLVRGSDRFRILAVVDPTSAGQDAGELLDGIHRAIPIVPSITVALASSTEPPTYCIVGIATHGGRFTGELRRLLLEGARAGLSLVNGLHDYIADETKIVSELQQQGLHSIDLRKPKSTQQLHFWTGAIAQVRAPRIAVLGMDCAIGKRTTARLLVQTLNDAGVRTEMIYTGQTGWMQGGRYGFVLDAVVNDYVSGELEHAIVTCDQEQRPDVIIIEGQSSLRNPSGPCGAEFLVSAAAQGVILQHAPGREFFEGYESLGYRIPPLETEIALIDLYNARTLAITLHQQGLEPAKLIQYRRELQDHLGIPVICPLQETLDPVVEVVRRFIRREQA
jgi:uncharacterized NAD-dependent epimerase/dehydratase family protein